MAEFIDGAIDRIEGIVKHGKPKLLRKKLKVRVLKPFSNEAPEIGLTDNISKTERKKICRKASNAANNSVSRVKKEVSDKVRKDLGLE